MAGEAGISKAAEQTGQIWISGICLIGGMLTSAATLRIGMHTFFGWGTEPITDEAAEVGELPETPSEDQRIFWYQFVPAAICISIPILLLLRPVWLDVLCNASAVFARRSAMLHLIYLGPPVTGQLPVWSEAWKASAVRGAVTFFLAILLACTSVFRLRLKRIFRLGPFLESGLRPLHTMQSGHPGDYVLWLTIGLAIIGAASITLLRT
jgi:multicomponent Na+:H+ antiporter subunit D